MGNNKVGDTRSRSEMSGTSVLTNTPDRRQSNKRMYSFTSSIMEEREAIRSLMDSRQSHWSQMGKMLIVIAIPVLSQMVLSVMNLVRATSVQANVAQAQRGINTFFLIDDLVTNLQVERGTTATFLSSFGTDRSAYSRLVNVRRISDIILNKIQDWPPEGLRISNRHFEAKQKLKGFLDSFRTAVDDINVRFEYNIKFYTNITKALIAWGQYAVVLPEKGQMWPLLLAQGSLTRASDAIGIRRALGSSFITLCEMSQEGSNWITSLQGEAKASLIFAFAYHQSSRQMYEDRFSESILEEELVEQEALIRSPNFHQICSNYTEEERFLKSYVWFSNMTSYMIMIKDIRTRLMNDILNLLEDLTESQRVLVIMYVMIVVIVTTACFSLTFWYSAKLYQMMSKITSYAKKMSGKSVQLAGEKKRSEKLLYQMIPRAVADQLKEKKEVKAEFYGQVTIMFSDIVGFTSMCAMSTPLQVVDMLNLLYSVFDASIDRYDVYKVETIGDAYMVVSGVPNPIEHHALEMAHLSMELMVVIKDVNVQHIDGLQLEMRLGLHSGSCVAGVVGVKMPRYCLFGDTVNTASKMESTGVAKKIQISQSTRDALTAHGGFLIEKRGIVDIQGKGEMTTYFVNGCDGDTCRHKLNPINGSQFSRDSAASRLSYKALKFNV